MWSYTTSSKRGYEVDTDSDESQDWQPLGSIVTTFINGFTKVRQWHGHFHAACAYWLQADEYYKWCD